VTARERDGRLKQAESREPARSCSTPDEHLPT
jgi:hypothetical protein